MQHTSVLSYFVGAGFVVKSVMFILLIASIISWTLIIQRALYFKKKREEYDAFSTRFWSTPDLSLLYKELSNHPDRQQGLASIFHAGFKEFLRMSKHGVVSLEPIERVMQIKHAKEEEAFEKHLPWFASVGSIAVYIGLFGTVWGIMTSLQDLGNAQQATIAMVAPGISEALVATALGLFTAIPAVLAYNRYRTRVEILLKRYDIFQEELLALIVQQTPSAQTEVEPVPVEVTPA
ncbi:MAG: protein TolQ [Legionellaceae bacterium]|nr:protein TolQ [Legionellaceae bacterium]